jgi:succinate dehydrogenase / fumarate reductase cytochrome b subunit
MRNRPKYLNLMQIRMPVTAVVSIMHRASGAALFLALPLLLWWWQLTLTSVDTFDAFRAMISHVLVKLILLGLLWGYLHHVCAGIRHLVLDLDMATDLPAARLTSMLVLAVSIGLTVVTAVLLW